MAYLLRGGGGRCGAAAQSAQEEVDSIRLSLTNCLRATSPYTLTPAVKRGYPPGAAEHREQHTQAQRRECPGHGWPTSQLPFSEPSPQG
eukprot:1149709-Pelagomonas_calceolata.AAC.4